MIYTFHAGKCSQLSVPGADLGHSLGGRCRKLQENHLKRMAPVPVVPIPARKPGLREAFASAKATLQGLLPSSNQEEPELA